MKIALVHDYLVQYGGAERVLEAFAEIFPKAPIYTMVYDEKLMGKALQQVKLKLSESREKLLYQVFRLLRPQMFV